jgi:hypothetical protein
MSAAQESGRNRIMIPRNEGSTQRETMQLRTLHPEGVPCL